MNELKSMVSELFDGKFWIEKVTINNSYMANIQHNMLCSKMLKNVLKMCEILLILLNNEKVKEELIVFAKLWPHL